MTLSIQYTYDISWPYFNTKNHLIDRPNPETIYHIKNMTIQRNENDEWGTWELLFKLGRIETSIKLKPFHINFKFSHSLFPHWYTLNTRNPLIFWTYASNYYNAYGRMACVMNNKNKKGKEIRKRERTHRDSFHVDFLLL